MSAYIVGLTGGIGSGKSAACEAFAEWGVDIIDADIIARQVVEPDQDAFLKIVDKFGQQVVATDGGLNRAHLRQVVFAESSLKDWLNKLLHPLIREQMQQQCALATSPYCILAVPLLVENNLQHLAHSVVVVDVSEATQLERASHRDQNSQKQIKAIMAAQASREQRLAVADKVLDNNGSLEQLHHQVKKLHKYYLKMADSPQN